MHGQPLCLSSGTYLLTLSLAACGGKTADSWSQPVDPGIGGTGLASTTGELAPTIGGSVALGAGGSTVTAAGGSFDYATGGSVPGSAGGASGELVPVDIDPVQLTDAPCGPGSLTRISSNGGCSVMVPLLHQGCDGETSLADLSLANAWLTRSDGKVFLVPRSTSGCSGHGWDSNAAGSSLWLCPQTCDALSDNNVLITIAFGCPFSLCIY